MAGATVQFRGLDMAQRATITVHVVTTRGQRLRCLLLRGVLHVLGWLGNRSRLIQFSVTTRERREERADVDGMWKALADAMDCPK